MDAPSRSQVESEKSSRTKAEEEPREAGIAASVCWEVEDRVDMVILGMHLDWVGGGADEIQAGTMRFLPSLYVREVKQETDGDSEKCSNTK